MTSHASFEAVGGWEKAWSGLVSARVAAGPATDNAAVECSVRVGGMGKTVAEESVLGLSTSIPASVSSLGVAGVGIPVSTLVFSSMSLTGSKSPSKSSSTRKPYKFRLARSFFLFVAVALPCPPPAAVVAEEACHGSNKSLILPFGKYRPRALIPGFR